MPTSVCFIVAFAAGAGMAFQVVVNTRLKGSVGEPMIATLISLAVGAVLALIYSLIAGYKWPALEDLGSAPWWAWIGGFFGVLFLWVSIVVSPKLGVALTLSVIIAGQVATATLIDQFGLLGAKVRPATLGKVAGVALVAIGVAMVATFRE